MSTRRLAVTAASMGLVAVALSGLTPGIGAMVAALADAQRTVDRLGPDALVMSAAGLLAWAVWAWGALGLALTAASAVPGLVGTAARLALRVALPAGARRGAAVLLGIGLGVTAPLAASALPALAPAAAADSTTPDVPDWPGPVTENADPVPEWPAGAPTADTPVTADRVVVRGDCLWHIAADSLLGQLGR